MDNFKKCSKCGEVKLLDCFSKNKTKKDGYNAECKKCSSEYKKNHYVGNLEKIKATTAKYRAENPEKRKSINAKYYVENAEKIKARTDKYTEQLTDTYIKNQIKQQTGVPYEHITQELIETKRLHILIKRKLKDLTK